jgi:hypothetical protein
MKARFSAGRERPLAESGSGFNGLNPGYLLPQNQVASLNLKIRKYLLARLGPPVTESRPEFEIDKKMLRMASNRVKRDGMLPITQGASPPALNALGNPQLNMTFRCLDAPSDRKRKARQNLVLCRRCDSCGVRMGDSGLRIPQNIRCTRHHLFRVIRHSFCA